MEDEIWRFLGLFAESTGLMQLRSRTADTRGALNQDTILEYLGNPVPDICLVDFDRDPRAGAIISERIHTALPETAVCGVVADAARRHSGCHACRVQRIFD